MAIYLIDFENVTSAGISGIQKLTKDDKVYIFYTVNASNMSFAAHMNLLSSPAEIIYYNVTSGGKNALDFQLSSFLGYLISRGEDKDFCIISNDRGYDHVKSFWEKSGLAAGVTINSAPSINRSLLPMDRPFTSKIQQSAQNTEKIAETPEAETMPETVSAASEITETISEKSEISQEVQVSEAARTTPSPENTAENKPAARRGRPKKQTAETSVKKSANNENKKSVEKSAKAKSKEEAMNTLREAVKPLLEKAGIKSNGDIINIANLLKSAEGKQQFYCKLTKSYGMEKGLTVYKAIRTEYTNLTKLVKQ